MSNDVQPGVLRDSLICLLGVFDRVRFYDLELVSQAPPERVRAFIETLVPSKVVRVANQRIYRGRGWADWAAEISLRDRSAEALEAAKAEAEHRGWRVRCAMQEHLRLVIEEAGISLREAARRAGVDYRVLHRQVRYGVPMTLVDFVLVAQKFRFSVDALAGIA